MLTPEQTSVRRIPVLLIVVVILAAALLLTYVYVARKQAGVSQLEDQSLTPEQALAAFLAATTTSSTSTEDLEAFLQTSSASSDNPDSGEALLDFLQNNSN